MSLSPLCRRACPVFTRREVWLPVPVPTRHRWGHQYQVSSLGRVRRLNPRTGHARMLTTYVSRSNGYLCVSLGAYDKATRTGGCTLVHRLVALAAESFVGSAEEATRVLLVDNGSARKARMDPALELDLVRSLESLEGSSYVDADVLRLAARVDAPLRFPDEGLRPVPGPSGSRECSQCGHRCLTVHT